MRLSDRLKFVRETSGKSQKEFAAQIEVSFRAWQDYEAGNSVPGGKVIEGLVNAGFNANWILSGKGPVLLQEEPQDSVSGTPEENPNAWYLSAFVTEQSTSDLSKEFVLVPRYEVSASAGGGAPVYSEQVVDYLSFKRNWVQNVMGLSVKELALINVKGDSMEPTLSSDDMILVDLRSKKIQENAIYVLQLNGGLLVKRIQRKLDGTVIVKGDNPIYEPEILQSDAAGMLNVIGRVVWCGRRM